jgi:hypothetical protein
VLLDTVHVQFSLEVKCTCTYWISESITWRAFPRFKSKSHTRIFSYSNKYFYACTGNVTKISILLARGVKRHFTGFHDLLMTCDKIGPCYVPVRHKEDWITYMYKSYRNSRLTTALFKPGRCITIKSYLESFSWRLLESPRKHSHSVENQRCGIVNPVVYRQTPFLDSFFSAFAPVKR